MKDINFDVVYQIENKKIYFIDLYLEKSTKEEAPLRFYRASIIYQRSVFILNILYNIQFPAELENPYVYF